MSIFLSKNTLKTKKIGEFLARKIFKKGPQKRALVLGLIGGLGGGKTTFLQGFAKGLSTKEKVLSPTFIIMRRLKIPKGGFKNFYHFDCYRIQKPKELLSLGWEKIIKNPENILAIEWADRILKILPKDSLILKFDFIDNKTRRIMIKYRNGKK